MRHLSLNARMRLNRWLYIARISTAIIACLLALAGIGFMFYMTMTPALPVEVKV